MSAPRIGQLAVVLFIAPALAAGADHVRVILDTSQSMLTNDRPRLAALSTALLYDLANPNQSLGDTFEVLLFEQHGAEWTGDSPPGFAGPRITPRPGDRNGFLNALRATPYNAGHTYYYPALSTAIADLEHTGRADDRKLIVLITDGKPEDRLPDLVRRDLMPRLVAGHMRLYILAFGPEASNQSQLIHDTLGGSAVADLLVDRDGRRLAENMIEIFSRAFGYSSSIPASLGELNLEGGQSPGRVAVVAYRRDPIPPATQLLPPHGGVNSPEGWRTARETGASYGLQWVLSPAPGMFRMSMDTAETSMVILRPAAFTVEVQPAVLEGHTGATMARTPFPLKVLVRPPGSIRGFQGSVEVSYQVHGPRKDDLYVWDSQQEAPRGDGAVINAGRVFEIAPSFPKDPESPRESYDGYLTIEVRRHGVLVGSLRGDHAHHVTVYPYVRLEASPPQDHAKIDGQARALERRETACADFHFVLQGALPHPARPEYSVRAVLDPSSAADPRLDRAQVSLDGEPVEFDRSAREHHGSWYGGLRMNAARLIGRHTACIQVGRPRDVEPGQPAGVKMLFTLIETPYDGAPTMTPFVLRALLTAPSWVERHEALLALGAALLTTALLAWYCRFRPAVPPKLAWAAAHYHPGAHPWARDSVRTGAAGAMGPPSPLKALLGWPEERPIMVDASSPVLGWVRPVSGHVYLFRCAPGVRVRALDDAAVEYQNGLAKLAVERTYMASTSDREYHIRAECLS